MNIAITGANGYIGRNLSRYLESKGFVIKPVSRIFIYGAQEQLSSYLSGTGAVINLAGAPVLQRWTKSNKAIIYNSRIQTTWNLTNAINELSPGLRPPVFISASATGIYTNDKIHDESSRDFNNGFLGNVVKDWENSSSGLDKNVRRVIFRLGMVLGKESQTIKKLLPVFKAGLGGCIGSGKQSFPYIHIDDLTEAIYQSITDQNFEGTYNLVAPDQIDNKTFTKTLAGLLKKPAFLKVPAFVLRLIYGNAASLMLSNPVVIPQRLTEQGYQFIHASISSALKDATSKNQDYSIPQK